VTLRERKGLRASMVVEVPVSNLLEKLKKLRGDERITVPEPRNEVDNAVNNLKYILSFLQAAKPNQGNITASLKGLLASVYSADNITERVLLTTVQSRRRKGVIELPLMKELEERLRAVSSKSSKIKEMQDRPHDLSNKTVDPISEVSVLEGLQYDQQLDVLSGREDEEEELVKRLIKDEEESLRVIPLVSEEALGKTALARTVYNRPDVRKHFQCRAWLHIPKDFKYEDLLLNILRAIPECVLKGTELLSETELTFLLVKSLMEHRFLIVLDDFCNVDVWFKLVRLFADAANRSRVILTTRDPNVARSAELWSCPLKLKLLTDEVSWDLFLKKVGRSDDTELNKFRVEILRLCRGLPPAILLLGGLLSTIQLTEWSEIIDHLALFGEDQSLPLSNIAALSNHKLPYVLKPCFLYLALFPKGYEIPTRRLLRLWLAEGFVQMSPKASDVPEDVANKYLRELVCRNMIEIGRWKSDGSPKTCRMPCYLYDVFLPKVEEIGFLHVHHSKTGCTSAYPLEFNIQRFADQFGINSTSDSHVEHLCSYVSFDPQKQSNREIGKLLITITDRSGFVLLKVLDLEGVYKPMLPEKLGELQNLKYLGLRWTGLDLCPESIGNLPRLETLDLKYTNITTLPSPVWKAKNLRHLHMNELSIQKPSKKLSTNLHTLMGLHIGSKDPKIYGLDRCTNLRKLGLTCHSKSVKKTTECITRLVNLKTLKLRSRDRFGQVLDLELNLCIEHPALSNLYLFGVIKDGIGDLPQRLKVLTLSMSGLKDNKGEESMLRLGELPQLKVLRLFAHSYVGSTMTCEKGKFPELRILKLWKLEKLKRLTVKDGSMPKLLELEIRGCKKLKMLTVEPPARERLVVRP
jgi:Leucine-rich repeat (LRR) protein